MTYFHAIILGFIQGITEFLPVSSSGHLVIFRKFFEIENTSALAFDAVLQLATTLAIVIYFYPKLKSLWVERKSIETKRLVLNIIIASIPIVILGLILEKYMETFFREAHLVAYALILGSLIMWFAEKKYTRFKNNLNSNISFTHSLFIGFFQALAIIPGMSRSGMTISGGLINKINRERALEFSFLISLPILIGTGLKKLFDLYQIGFVGFGGELLVGSLVSFVIGLFSIQALMYIVKNKSLNSFVYYRIILALILILFI
jgi:undecaprenyl-diphosphatase